MAHLEDQWALAQWAQVDLVGLEGLWARDPVDPAIICQEEVPLAPQGLREVLEVQAGQATVDPPTTVDLPTTSTLPRSTDWDLAGHALCQIHPQTVDLKAEYVVSPLAGRVRQGPLLFLLRDRRSRLVGLPLA